MKYLQGFDELSESVSSQTKQRDRIAGNYFKLQDVARKSGVVIGEYEGVKVRVVNRDLISDEHPEWKKYIGSHHWGKRTGYIPEDEIWIVQDKKFTPSRIKKLLNHEIIERQMMRALIEDRKMSTLGAWKKAHGYVKKMGF